MTRKEIGEAVEKKMAEKTLITMLKTVGQYAYRIAVTVIISLTIIKLIEPTQPKTVTQEIAELANDWKPNWEDPHQLKFYIYDGPEGLSIGESNVRRIYGVSYFETASQAGEAMLYLSDKLRVRE